MLVWEKECVGRLPCPCRSVGGRKSGGEVPADARVALSGLDV